MPIISNALNAFRNLLDYNYHFSISCQKQLHNIILNFEKNDFHHLAGFQYLKDIDIPKSTTQLYSKIDTHKINDKMLSGSVNYCNVNDSYANVESRIYGLQFLKEYIESKNIILKYIKGMNKYSSIQADFLIKSIVEHKTAYLFLRKRSKSDYYCLCSFFVEPQVDYLGIRSYWLYKSSINLKTHEENVMLNRMLEDKPS